MILQADFYLVKAADDELVDLKGGSYDLPNEWENRT